MKLDAKLFKSRVTSLQKKVTADRGHLITVCRAVNTMGNSLPLCSYFLSFISRISFEKMIPFDRLVRPIHNSRV